MNNSDQTSLLHLMETRIISETKINKTREMKLTSWVFAIANSCKKIIEPLLSRFAILEMPEYSLEEFCEIAVTSLRKENIEDSTARFIAANVWNELGSRDIRDVIKVARLANNIQQVSNVLEILKNHRAVELPKG